MAKVDKPTAMYYEPASIGSKRGARCGICMMFVVDGQGNPVYKCTVVEGHIDPKVGVCGLYVHGQNHKDDGMYGKLSKDETSYTEQGPTHCWNCEYKVALPRTTKDGYMECQKVEGIIHAFGCCNLWDPEDKIKPLLDVPLEKLGL